jgi:glutamyl-tRNA synthetase
LADHLDNLESFTAPETEQMIRNMAEGFDVKPGILINGTRTVVTGQLAGPGIFDVLVTLGRYRVVERLRKSEALFE